MTPILPLLHLLSPPNARGRLSVLIFHRILEKPDPLFPGEPDANCFDAILGWLKLNFNILPLDEAVDRLKTHSLPARAAAITFDDGYADNYHIALPILKKHGLNATVFVATGFLDGGIMWNDAIIETIRNANNNELNLEAIGLGHHDISSTTNRHSTIIKLISAIKYLNSNKRKELVTQIAMHADVTLPKNLMMTSSEVLSLRKAGVLIGAHTISHPILKCISPDQARQEIVGSKAVIESILDEPVSLFAYPNGKPNTDYLAEHVNMVKDAGFSLAMSTSWGAAGKNQDLFQIPRFTPWDRSKYKFLMRMAQNLIQHENIAA